MRVVAPSVPLRPAAAALALCVCLQLRVVASQQAGSISPEQHPLLTIESCSASGCFPEASAVTLDANWRWVHEVDGYANCFTGSSWSSRYCPDGATCAQQCAIEGVTQAGYDDTYGVQAIPGGVELDYVSKGGNVGSRLYLLDGQAAVGAPEAYKVFFLKNREITFDVDASKLACGLNGAVYLVEMDKVGGFGRGKNAAGAKFGTGYCDAQCPHDIKWIKGEANIDGRYGACCAEMDLWEANRRATAYTTHACTVEGLYRCDSSMTCGDNDSGDRYRGVCDKDGCDLNPYRLGSREYYGYGPDFEVDTSKVVTVVTQFLTHDGTDEGDLSEIRRFYVQDGVVIPNSNATIPGIQGNSITDAFCKAEKEVFEDVDDFSAKGGLKTMGDAIGRGMVLALSIWDDPATHMSWLDSVHPSGMSPNIPGVRRGPCENTMSDLRQAHKSATVKYMNIRYGEVGTTFKGAEAGVTLDEVDNDDDDQGNWSNESGSENGSNESESGNESGSEKRSSENVPETRRLGFLAR